MRRRHRSPCLRSHLGAAVPPRGCSLLGVPKEGQQLNGSAAAHAEIKGEILPSGFFAFSRPFATPRELSGLSGGFCRAFAFPQDAAPEHQPRPRTCAAAGDSQSRQLPGKPARFKASLGGGWKPAALELLPTRTQPSRDTSGRSQSPLGRTPGLT